IAAVDVTGLFSQRHILPLIQVVITEGHALNDRGLGRRPLFAALVLAGPDGLGIELRVFQMFLLFNVRHRQGCYFARAITPQAMRVGPLELSEEWNTIAVPSPRSME